MQTETTAPTVELVDAFTRFAEALAGVGNEDVQRTLANGLVALLKSATAGRG